MADERRSRTKRETSQTRKDKPSSTLTKPQGTAGRSKPSNSDVTKTSTVRKPSQSTAVLTSRDSSRKIITGQLSQNSSKLSGNKPVQQSSRVSTTTTSHKIRTEPVIQQKHTSTGHQNLSKKVTLSETLPRSKVDIPVKNNVMVKRKVRTTDTKTVIKTSQNSNHKDPKILKERSSSRLSRDRTRTRTLSPGESQLIRLGSGVEVGPDTIEIPVQDQQTIEDDYYESDFESDFESPSPTSNSSSSSEEEPEVETLEQSNGPQEMITQPVAVPRLLHAAPSKPNIQLEVQKRSTKPTVEKIQRETTEIANIKPKVTFNMNQNRKDNIIVNNIPMSVMNFSLARQRLEKLEASKRAKIRGTELLSMIKLDTVTVILVDLPPSKYEVLMSSYGTQIQTQTGEGKLDEEVQTETIDQIDHWTQHPPCPHTETTGLHAVGPIDETETPTWSSLDYVRLEIFLNRAAEVIFTIMSEETMQEEKTVTSSLGLIDLAESGIMLGSEVTEFLVERPAKLLQFVDHCRILTLHLSANQQQDRQDLILVWSEVQPSLPRYILGSRATVTCLCVHPDWPNIIVAGCCDGTLSVWDLQELAYYHPTLKIIQGRKFNIRTPTYCTVETAGTSHYASVVRVLSSTSGNQLISVDVTGLVQTWSVVRQSVNTSRSTYCLVRSHSLQISTEDAEVTDTTMFGDRLLVALDTGVVISVTLLVKQANRTYIPSNDYMTLPGATSIEVSPCNGQQQFLVLDSGGSMRLYQDIRTQPIWTSPTHELGDSSPRCITWGVGGLLCLIPGHVQLWHVPSPRPTITCRVNVDIVSLVASPFTDQFILSTHDGKLYVIKMNSKIIPIQSMDLIGG